MPQDIKISADAPVAPVTGTPASPVPPPEAPKTASLAGMQSIFNQPKSPIQGSKVLESILASKEIPGNTQSILGKNAMLQESIQKEHELKQKKNFRLSQTVFISVFFSMLAMSAYFFIEVSPTFDLFGPNTTARLTDMNQNLRSLQTQVNKYRYLMAQLDLNAFSLVSDSFLDETSKLALGTLDSTVTLNRTIEDLPAYLENIRGNLSPDITLPLYRSESEEELTPDQITDQYETDLKSALNEDLKRISSSGEALTDLSKQEIRILENSMKLVGNSRLLGLAQRSSPEDFKNQMNDYAKTLDPEKRTELQTFISGILASTKSEVATISTLKSGRINWSGIIKDIEEVTVTVDKNFGRGLTRALGEGILYTGYEFDTNTNTIVLSGSTLTNDAYNFTIISRLIEALEKDLRFHNVEMRSFSKSGTPEEGYSANFKIDLQLETQADSMNNKTISLQGTPVSGNNSAASSTPVSGTPASASGTPTSVGPTSGAPRVPVAASAAPDADAPVTAPDTNLQ